MTFSSTPSSSSNLLASSAKGASLLILLQIASRGLTFIVNQVLLRYLAPELLGISSQLDLYAVSILYFSRESVRVALQRSGGIGNGEDKAESTEKLEERKSKQIQEIVNFSYIPLVLGIILSFILGFLYLFYQADHTIRSSPFFLSTFLIYNISTLLELATEPYHALAQKRLLYGVRASAEGAGAFAKCLLTCVSVVWAARNGYNLGALPFAFGQLGLAVSLLLVYAFKLQSTVGTSTVTVLNPNKILQLQFPYLRFPPTWLPPVYGLYKQGILKQMLTNGDSYLMALFTPLAVQGSYALAANYGGLVARIVLQPIEESSRSFWGRCLATLSEEQKQADSQNRGEDKRAGSTEQHKDNSSKGQRPTTSAQTSSSKMTSGPLNQSLNYLTTLLHTYTLLSLLVLPLLPPLIPHLLFLVAGSRWSSDPTAPSVLSAYAYYLPLLAVNGLLEAFISSVASPKDLDVQNRVMVGSSIAFIAAGWGCLQWREGAGMGARGLVVANAVAMMPRIVWGIRYARRWFRRRGTEMRWFDGSMEGGNEIGVVPSWGIMAIATVAWRIMDTRGGEARDGQMESEKMKDLGTRISIVIAIYVGGVPFVEKRFLFKCWHMLRPAQGIR